MADYTDIGLDQFLKNTNQVSFGGTVTSYNSNFDQNTISGYNIRNFSFSAGTGGTLALGGSLNSNGYLSVRNDAGTEIVKIDTNGISVKDGGGTEHVKIDETGLNVYNGSVSLSSESGTVFLDKLGLVSSIVTNAGSSAFYGTATAKTIYGTATSDTALATVSLSLTRNTSVLILGETLVDTVLAGTADFRAYVNLKININGTTKSRATYTAYQVSSHYDNNEKMTLNCHTYEFLGSGSYDVVLAGSVGYQTGLAEPYAQIRGWRLTTFYIGN